MSLDFEYAPYCKGKNCDHQLTSWADVKNGYCADCLFELEKKWDAEKEEKLIRNKNGKN